MILAFALHADFSQPMYVFEDFMVYIPLSFFMVKSYAADKLKGLPPTSRVFGMFPPHPSAINTDERLVFLELHQHEKQHVSQMWIQIRKVGF